ncbi:apicoplast ribosomal protein L33 precursor, putative [Hepatocystis sp. ex Piliocolobus tephrosceles]|nr:apicoplast ribosomal protein L33 precursor, putative [Hepatocystis sp. ex Piliocolobus tephrosceles]
MKKYEILANLLFFILIIIIKCYHQFIIPKHITETSSLRLTNCCSINIFAKKKKNRRIVVIECTEARKCGKQPSRYVTEKNRVNTPKKLQLYKYNKYLKKRTLHVEIK